MKAYSYNRPVSIGTYPSGYSVAEIVNFDSKQYVEEVGKDCWGYVEFSESVPRHELESYELVTEEMYQASKPNIPSDSVIRKMARLCAEGQYEELERLCSIAERKGYDMEAINNAVCEYV